MRVPTGSAGISNTVDVASARPQIPVDTGFIVFNRRTYPNLTALFELAPGADETIRNVVRGFAGRWRGGIFRRRPVGSVWQPRNLFRPRFWSMLADIIRFYRECGARYRSARRQHQSRRLSRKAVTATHFATIICCRWRAAIWSATPAEMLSLSRRRPSSASTTIMACCNLRTGPTGKLSSAAAAPMSSA